MSCSGSTRLLCALMSLEDEIDEMRAKQLDLIAYIRGHKLEPGQRSVAMSALVELGEREEALEERQNKQWNAACERRLAGGHTR